MTTGNLPIQAFSAVVTPEQGYKVTLNFGAGFDLTNPAVRVYQRSKQLTAGVPALVVTGQQIVITYSVEQLTELRKAASVTQHHIYLPNMPYTTRVGWEITVVNKFSDGVQVESLLGVTLGPDGETIAVSISGADVVAGLVAQAEAAADSVVEDAAQTALDRVATGADRTQTGEDRAAVSSDRALAVTARNEAVAAKDLAVPAAATATTKAGEAAADRVQTGLDRIATAADRVVTAADRVVTAADRAQTGLDAASALASKNAIPVGLNVYTNDAAAYAAIPTIPIGNTYLIEATGDNVVEIKRRTGASSSDLLGKYIDSDAVIAAIGSQEIIESSVRSANIAGKGSSDTTDDIWENQYAATAKAYQKFKVSVFRWSGTGNIYVYINTAGVFTLVAALTPTNVDTLQTFEVNFPVPAGSTICLNGNISYRPGGGIGLKKYHKTNFTLTTTLAAFEIAYNVEFINIKNPLIPVDDKIDTAKSELLGGSTKTIQDLDDQVSEFTGLFSQAVDLSTKSLSPNNGLAAGTLADAPYIWENQFVLTDKAYVYFDVSFVRNAGVSPVLVYINTGGIFTLVATLTPLDVSTVQTFRVNHPLPINSRIGLNGNIGYHSSAGVGLKSWNKTTFGLNSTLPTFELKYKVDLYTERVFLVENGQLSIKNSDKIIPIGNSYIEGGWQLRMKHFTNNISMLSDFIVAGYATGGFSLQQVFDQLVADTPIQGWPKPSTLQGTYALIALQTNNTNTGEQYFDVLLKLCDKLEAMGMRIILASEHYGASSAIGKYLMAMSDLAKKRDYPLILWGNEAQKNRVTGFNPFQYPPANHIGTRPNWAWVDGLMPYLAQITVRKSIKLFRQRTGVDFTVLPVFSNNAERGKSFEELEIGTKAHSAANEINFDRQNTMTPAGGTYTGTKNDYANIINNNAVSFGSYALISIILDFHNLDYATLNTISSGVTNVYYKKYDNTWVEITPFSASLALKNYLPNMSGRKIVLLLKGASITISDVKVDYAGINKVSETRISTPVKISTNSQFTATFGGVNWTFGPGVTDYSPVVDPSNGSEVEELPIGISLVKELNTIGEYVSTAFTPPGATSDQIELQIRVLARNFPTFIDQDAKWATSKITTSSFDMAKIKITVTQGSNVIVVYKWVGLWWKDVIVDTIICGATSTTIKVESSDDCNLQLASIGAYY